MRTAAVLLCVLALASICLLSNAAETKYTNKYDNIDIDAILNNQRVLTNYIKCIMDEAPCTPEGRELKKVLPDALATECVKCNEKQKTTAEKVLSHLVKHRPRDWERLTKKFDPEGKYRKRYDEIISSKKL